MKQDDTVTISKNGEPTEVIFEEYLDYRRGFEAEYLNYFTIITESPGSPFLNKYIARNVSSCNYQGRNCLAKIELGVETCDNGYTCKYEITERLQVVDI